MTNPAIDREREVEHFSCRAVFGARPALSEAGGEAPATIETAVPSHARRHHGLAPLSDEAYRASREHKTYLLEDLWEAFRGRNAVIDISCSSPRRSRARSSG